MEIGKRTGDLKRLRVLRQVTVDPYLHAPWGKVGGNEDPKGTNVRGEGRTFGGTMTNVIAVSNGQDCDAVAEDCLNLKGEWMRFKSIPVS